MLTLVACSRFRVEELFESSKSYLGMAQFDRASQRHPLGGFSGADPPHEDWAVIDLADEDAGVMALELQEGFGRSGSGEFVTRLIAICLRKTRKILGIGRSFREALESIRCHVSLFEL